MQEEGKKACQEANERIHGLVFKGEKDTGKRTSKSDQFSIVRITG